MVTSNPARVSVVIATRGRPELLRRAVRSIFDQDYQGVIDLTVVFDQTVIDPLGDIDIPAAHRRIHTVANERTPGLAGGRNTGILAATGDLIAFCDDDDEWLPAKLRTQIDAWERDRDAVLVATGIRIATADRMLDRLPPRRTEFMDLIRSRTTEIHPSSFLVRRSDIIDRIGLVDEQLPASYGEDYDFLLRAAKCGHILGVTEPLVVVHWNRTSFFDGKWRGIADGLRYLLEKHPEFADSAVGAARIEGQIAFAFAALGDREEAVRWARATLQHDRAQLRAYAALAIAARLVPAGALVGAVNRRGRGL